MLKLIAREMYDQLVYIGACWSLSAMVIGILISTFVWGFGLGGFMFSVGLMPILFLGFCALGVAQMYGDRANRISVLLATQAVTRSRILTARVLVGVLTVLVALIPILLVTVFLLRLRVPPFEFYSGMVWDVALVLGLTGFASYCMGLLVGWTGSWVRLIVGSVSLIVLVLALVAVKGFGLSAAALLLLLIVAVLGRIWHTFTSASL